MYYHRPNRRLYLDVRYSGDNFWDLVFSEDATTVVLDTTNFDTILGPDDADLQVAMETLDDHGHPGTGVELDTTNFDGILSSLDDEVQHAFDTLDDHTHTLNSLANPDGDKTFVMTTRQLEFLWTNPSGNPLTLEASGAYTGALLHIHQHTGNPGSTYLLELESEDSDVEHLSSTMPSTGLHAICLYVAGDTDERFVAHSGGELAWGPGNAAQDTNLYRSAADTLKTDDDLVVGGGDITLNATTLSEADLIDLTDGGDTTLHGHDVTGLTNWGGPYLPLTAGIGQPLSGTLYIDSASVPAVILREGGENDNRFVINTANSGIASLSKYSEAGVQGLIRIDPVPSDGSSNAILQFFRTTNTSGTRQFSIFVGDGTNTIQHKFLGEGGANLCQQGGEVNVGDVSAFFSTDQLNVGGGIVIANGNSLWGDAVGHGSLFELIGITAANQTRFGNTSARTFVRSSDVVRISAAASDPGAAALAAGEIAFFLDESGDYLKVRAKYSGGTNKTGTVCALT